MKLKRLKEQWTPTSIQASFGVPPLKSLPNGENLILELPLIILGWTFYVTLVPHRIGQTSKLGYSKKKIATRYVTQWRPSTMAFHNPNSAIAWERTSIVAELWVGSSESCTECNKTATDSTLLGALIVDLANTGSRETTLRSDYLSPLIRELGLMVILSECPFVDGPFGFFQANADHLHHGNLKTSPETRRPSNDNILCRSLITGIVSDVTFLTFDTRRALRLANEPIPMYASLSVLEEQLDISSDHFREEWRSVLSAAGGDTTSKPTHEIVCPPEYEYDLDSDFEDEDLDTRSSHLSCSGSEESDRATSEGESGSCEKTERSSSPVVVIDSAEATDEDSVDHNPMDIIKASETQLLSFPAATPRRTISIKFAAHKTWRAFLWYCYTGRVRFGKLRSLGAPKQQSEQIQDEPPVCSPKSMYRLADILGNEVLKAEALAGIQESLAETNIVEEAFSEFTSKYPEVQAIQLRALMEHSQTTEVKEAVLKMVLKFHKIPHATAMFSAFYDKLAE